MVISLMVRKNEMTKLKFLALKKRVINYTAAVRDLTLLKVTISLCFKNMKSGCFF